MPLSGLRGRSVCLALFPNNGVRHNKLPQAAVRSTSPCPCFEKAQVRKLTRKRNGYLVIVFYALLEHETQPALDGELPGSGLVGEVASRAGGGGITLVVDFSVVVCDEVVGRRDDVQPETPDVE